MKNNERKKAVVLLSGGVDSSTLLAVAKDEGYEIYALTFRYGQRHTPEIEASKNIAERLGVSDHAIIDLDLRKLAKSALTSHSPIPKDRNEREIGGGSIPATYVPARNTIFLSVALAWAESLGGADIFIGINSLDYSGYPDCRPEFIEAFQKMSAIATKIGVEDQKRIEIKTPLISMTKAEIIRKGTALGVDYSLTRSCYDPDSSGAACGRCDSCILRLKGFSEAGVDDPAPYSK